MSRWWSNSRVLKKINIKENKIKSKTQVRFQYKECMPHSFQKEKKNIKIETHKGRTVKKIRYL